MNTKSEVPADSGSLDPLFGIWQPIETCPRNKSVLLFLPNTEHYGPGIWRGILVDMGTGLRFHGTAWACGRDFEDEPTHWMPLPDVPNTELSGEKRPLQ